MFVLLWTSPQSLPDTLGSQPATWATHFLVPFAVTLCSGIPFETHALGNPSEVLRQREPSLLTVGERRCGRSGMQIEADWVWVVEGKSEVVYSRLL